MHALTLRESRLSAVTAQLDEIFGLATGDFGEALMKPNEPAPVFWDAERVRSVVVVFSAYNR